MSANKMRCVLIACSLAAILSMSATCQAGPILDWLCGTSPGMTTQTTYTPPYYAAEYAAPACATPACATPACATPACATPTYAAPAGGCSSCAQQVVQYAPYTSYRPVYGGFTIPRPVTTYYSPSTACNSCAAPTTAYYPAAAYNSYAPAVTAYRPVVAWTQPVRIIPYTTYRMSYMPVTYVGYAQAPACTTCASPCAAPCVSSCNTCGSCGVAGGCPTTYASPSCASCQPAITGGYTTPSIETPSASAPVISSPAPATDSTQPPKTFEGQKPAIGDGQAYPEKGDSNPDNKPASDPEKNIVPVPETKFNSSPGPQLLNPEDRTTSSPVRQAIYLVKRSAPPVQAALVQKTNVWRESRD
jgi:hypothetical protein